MADNTTLNTGTGGDVIRTEDRSGIKVPVSIIDKGAAGGAESLVSDANPFPVTLRESDGTELGTAGNPVRVDPTGDTPQPVSAASLPLPTGAATAANQATEIAALGAPADAEASGDGSLIALLKRLRTLLGGTLTVDGSGATQPISAASLPLPSGAAQDGTDGTGITPPTGGAGLRGWLSGIYKALTDRLPAALSNGNLKVSLQETGVTQPVSGTVSVSGTVTVGSHAVTNAGTFAVQDSEKVADNAGFTDGSTKVQPAGFIYDEVAGTELTENDAGAARMDVKRAQVLVLEDATTRGQRATVSAAGAVKVDGSGVTQPVSVSGTLPAADAGSNYTETRSSVSSGDITSATDLTTAPTSGQKVVLVDLLASTDTAMRIDLLEETSGTVLCSFYLASYAPVQFTPRGKMKLPTADKKIRVQGSTTGNVRLCALWRSEA